MKKLIFIIIKIILFISIFGSCTDRKKHTLLSADLMSKLNFDSSNDTLHVYEFFDFNCSACKVNYDNIKLTLETFEKPYRLHLNPVSNKSGSSLMYSLVSLCADKINLMNEVSDHYIYNKKGFIPIEDLKIIIDEPDFSIIKQCFDNRETYQKMKNINSKFQQLSVSSVPVTIIKNRQYVGVISKSELTDIFLVFSK